MDVTVRRDVAVRMTVVVTPLVTKIVLRRVQGTVLTFVIGIVSVLTVEETEVCITVTVLKFVINTVTGLVIVLVVC